MRFLPASARWCSARVGGEAVANRLAARAGRLLLCAMKIKANDDRIKSTAAAVLLLCRERWVRGDLAEPGVIGAALAEYRDDPEGFKERFPKRDLAAAKDLAAMVERIPGARGRERYQELIEAVDVVLARIERGKIQFSSLVELDNYFVANLRRFESAEQRGQAR